MKKDQLIQRRDRILEILVSQEEARNTLLVLWFGDDGYGSDDD